MPNINHWIIPGIISVRSEDDDPLIMWDIAVKVIEKRYGITKEVLFKNNRYAGVTYLRQLIVYWFLTTYENDKRVTLQWIADKMGGMDHTSVIHRRQAFKARLDVDSPIPDETKLNRSGFYLNNKTFEQYKPVFPSVCGTREDYEQFKQEIKLWP